MSESDSDSAPEVIDLRKTRKKGIRRVDEYKRNVLKKARVSGDSIVTSKGVVIPPKNNDDLDAVIACCKKMCFAKVDNAQLLQSRKTFYALSSKDEQDLYLQGLIESLPIKRRRPRVNPAKDREKMQKTKKKLVQYHAVVGTQRIKVCRSGFLKLFNISKTRADRVASLLMKSETPKDKRGMGRPAVEIKPEICALIHAHIASFPVHESHYCSKIKKYLSANLTVKTMHDLFIEKHPEMKGKVKYHFFWEYFHKNFTLTFGRPAQDTCSQCEIFKTKIKDPSLNDVAKRVATAEMMVHKRRSKKFYHSLKESSTASKAEGSKILGVCFDFMAVFDLPKIPVQDVYYFRQLSVNNFGIYNMRDDSMTSYVYHEGIARKSPDDVISFFLHYLTNFAPPDVEEIHIFCDNCGGQNKNHALIRTILALVELKMFKKVKIFFPIRGHSYLPCDRTFGLMKRKLKKIERIYTPDDYIDTIVSCSQISNKIRVMIVDSSMVKNVQKWYPQFYRKITSSIETRNKAAKHQSKFLISSYHYFEASIDFPGMVRTAQFIGGLITHTFPLRKPNVPNLDLPQDNLYEGRKNPINSKKVEDLKRLQQYIPDSAKHRFWNELLEWPTMNIS